MKYTELKDSIKSGAQPIYLLEGADAYFRINGEKAIKSAFLQMPELNYSSFDGETLKDSAISRLVSDLKNYPFMAEKRIVKVSEFYPSESEYENYLKPLFDDFPPTSILIIVNSVSKKGVDLKRKKNVAFVDCSKADEETVARWIYYTLRHSGLTVSSKACADIAAFCLCDMSRVALETQKIIDYKVEGTVTEEDVENLVYKDADYRVYELTNTVSRRDFTKFCEILDDLYKKTGDETYILNALFSYFKNLLTILTSRESDAEIAKLLKMKEYGVKKSREQAMAIGEKRLIFYVQSLYSLISSVKSGRLTPKNALNEAQNSIFFAYGNK